MRPWSFLSAPEPAGGGWLTIFGPENDPCCFCLSESEKQNACVFRLQQTSRLETLASGHIPHKNTHARHTHEHTADSLTFGESFTY